MIKYDIDLHDRGPPHYPSYVARPLLLATRTRLAWLLCV